MDGLPFWGNRFGASEVGARDLATFFPLFPGGGSSDSTKSIAAPINVDYEFTFPQAVLDLIRPSDWTFSIQYDDGGGFAEVHSSTVASGQFEDEGTLKGTDWETALWNADIGEGVTGIVRVRKTVSGIGSFEPIVFEVGVGQPIPFIDSGDQKWRLVWLTSYAESSPGSAAGQLRIVYDGETYFASETTFRCVVTRTPI